MCLHAHIMRLTSCQSELNMYPESAMVCVCVYVRIYIQRCIKVNIHIYIYVYIYIYIYIRIYMLLYMLSPREGMREEGKGEEGRRRREGEMDTGAHPPRGNQFLRPRLQDAYEVHSPIVFMYMYRYRYMYRYTYYHTLCKVSLVPETFN